MAALLLFSCNPPNKDYEDAKRLASYDLKDPESAKFRNMRHCPDAPDIVEGEMNGKNSYGAYAGYKPFWVTHGKVYTVDNANSSTDDYLAVLARCVGMSKDEFVNGTSKRSPS